MPSAMQPGQRSSFGATARNARRRTRSGRIRIAEQNHFREHHPEADIRSWDNLPLYLSFAALELPPGQHTITVDFLDQGNRLLTGQTKTITITVPAGADKIVYVSDKSTTPKPMKRILPLLAVGAAAVFSGCQTPETGALPPQNATQFDLENKANFVLMDPGVQHSVTCSQIQKNLLPDGRLAVAANVRNRENRRIQVQINCEFKDEQGFTIDPTPWKTLILTENGQETVAFESMNAQAKKYTFRVREAR